ncbi:MAG TPA: GNAT family N-acetyltransferase [Pyrinomonadaceae bacterium]|nr:GNAT family N-acetyltransferase [Pyrinomonadaceae bacterium]
MSAAQLMNTVMAESQYLPSADTTVSVAKLTDEDRNEVLAFLAERPIHTVCMVGFIRDNGIESELNRGAFWGCRNSEGRLEGVALIGHTTLIEVRTDRALKEFAPVAQVCSNTFLIMGEQERIEQFWNSYADDGQEIRLICRELLFELRRPVQVPERVEGLRLATIDDLDLIAPVHAAMAEAESGINPLNVDPIGFRQRCARRIERGRVWVVVENGQLVFKADIQADTPDVTYLEGIYVNSSKRGRGIGRACLAELTQKILLRSKSICLLVNETNEKACAFYRLSNFKLRGHYYTTFMQRENHAQLSN